MADILITGGCGFVGSHIAEAELADGHRVTVVDIDIEKARHLQGCPNFTAVQGTVLDAELLDTLIRGKGLVFHLAAIAEPTRYMIVPDEVLSNNIEGTALVSRLCLKHGAKMVLSSSSEVYGKNMSVPWTETCSSVMSSSETRWCYAISKLASEHYVKALGLKGLRYSIGRFFNFYGPRLHGRVISLFLERFVRNEPVLIVEPGDQTRCFTYVDDAITGFRLVAHHPDAEGETFNIGDDRETSMWELASLMKNIGQFSSPLKIVGAEQVYGSGYDDIPRRAPNITKIKNRLGWQASHTLEDGLAKTIAAYVKDFGRTA